MVDGDLRCRAFSKPLALRVFAFITSQFRLIEKSPDKTFQTCGLMHRPESNIGFDPVDSRSESD